MKKILISAICLSISLLPLRAEEEFIKEIKKLMRESAKHNTPKYPDFKIYDPFERVKKVTKNSKKIDIKVLPPMPVVKGIIDDNAFIDGKWRKVGDSVDTYEIVSIEGKTVTLKLGENRFTITVSAKSDNGHIIIKDRK
jgi:hypothetical protein